MMLTLEQREDFCIGYAIWNGLLRDEVRKLSRQELLALSDYVPGDVIQTHETLADFVKTHGAPVVTVGTPFGRSFYEWDRVQLGGKGKTRGQLFLMDFDGVSATYYTGDL
jgi:hypothetical protein